MKFIISVALLFLVFPLHAEFHCMSLIMKDGTNSKISLSDELKVKFADDNVIIDSDLAPIEYRINDVKGFLYTDDELTYIDSTGETYPTFSFKNDELIVYGCSSKVKVYDSEGNFILSCKSDDNDCTHVNTGPLPVGYYIVTFNTNSVKILKRR